MTLQEKLTQEFNAAIVAVLGDLADREYDSEELKIAINKADLQEIARKVAWYLDL